MMTMIYLIYIGSFFWFSNFNIFQLYKRKRVGYQWFTWTGPLCQNKSRSPSNSFSNLSPLWLPRNFCAAAKFLLVKFHKKVSLSILANAPRNRKHPKEQDEDVDNEDQDVRRIRISRRMIRMKMTMTCRMMMTMMIFEDNHFEWSIKMKPNSDGYP